MGETDKTTKPATDTKAIGFVNVVFFVVALDH